MRRFFPFLTLIVIVLGILAGGFPQLFGGDPVGETARNARTLIDPAPYAFSIWLPIFAGQLAFGVHQILPSNWALPVYLRIRGPAMINSLAAGGWSLAYTHHQYTVAWSLMLVTLASLVVLVMRMGKPSGAAYGFSYLTYHANLAWISVATMVNTAQFLHYQVGWSGAPLDPTVWAMILMAVATALAAFQMLVHRDVPFAAVVVWALVAIGVEQARAQWLPMVAFALAGTVALTALISAVRTPVLRHA